jgi:hypothetical protein
MTYTDVTSHQQFAIFSAVKTCRCMCRIFGKVRQVCGLTYSMVQRHLNLKRSSERCAQICSRQILSMAELSIRQALQ